MTENPWKTLSKKPIYENPWIRVEEHQVITPAGKEGIYGKVHFKNRAMAIIPIDYEGYTWLVGQYRYTLDEYSWEIPMGGGPNDLDLLESAKRELKEETGLLANKWTELLKIHTSNSVTDEWGLIYLAEDLTQGETEFEETEQLLIKKLPFQEALEMVMSGQITDSISVAGLLKAARILGY
ncbi:NUDIX domain-containing protein [Algoriphagus sanaruensis]|jgi:ADP-ribose pyrophosphatase|uniref:GDP-mannose pyrophosphatase n=1 Tax=Algoriphagus sanaruensis TaxID=1727163 RepID=A0A142EQ20_9BACT|nr:NUDIX hydrolase [Algoriphagus sanaruensis]AMQ57225.1 DNA mismatch repair protein MutT [Algoriphagus sanaruensis]